MSDKSFAVLNFQINTIRRTMEDLQYEKKQLQQHMNSNRQKMAECRAALKKLEAERREKVERECARDADVEPAAGLG